MQLFKLGGGSDDSPILDISPKSQMKGEVSTPHIVMRSDGYAFFWRYFNKKIKRETRDAGLFFRTCDLKLNNWSEPTRLAPDREIGVHAFRVYNLDDVALVVWSNGMSKKKVEIRYTAFASIAEIGQTPRPFSAPLPQAVIAVGEKKLALETEFSDQPYGFTLNAWPLPSGFA
jgi:hypothetical protein